MNRFFNFSTPQLRVVIFLSGMLIILSVYSFLRDYSEVDESRLKFSVTLGDNDQRYRPIIRIDLNSSPADSLELLPGIGPVLASRIISYRDTARFQKPEDIMKIKGIGYSSFEKLRDYIEVRPW
nr:helix-hairpin-helix domain-containing protein [candidate division Zixibacteria bacterium]